MRRYRIFWLLLFILIAINFILVFKTNKAPPPKKSQTKYILYWNELWRKMDFHLGFGSDIFKSCPEKNCYATNDKSFLDVENFDAIFFHGPEYQYKIHGVPEKRNPDQVYVFFNREPPKFHKLHDNFRNFFNWTMTYRSDSDVLRNYGTFLTKTTDYFPPSPEEILQRSGKIAWIVSNCNSTNSREKLYQEISKHIKVDVYGRCGNLNCPSKNIKNCYELVEKNYKFYLSFENSNCVDYVTEKLFYALKYNIVPIVYGYVNYQDLTPSKSVIDVSQFKNVTQLVSYIKRLDENVEEYLEYFQWKINQVSHISKQKALCDLCSKLHEPRVHKIYEDMREWWEGKDESICKKPLDIVFTH